MSKIKKLAFGVSWGAFATITVTGFQLAFMAIMARLLDPASFGMVAVANVCLRFFSFFAQMGIAPALIQKPHLETGDIAAAFSVSMGISLLFFALAAGFAPLFEQFYQMPGLSLVIQALAANFLIGGFSAVSGGLLQRQAAFRALAIIDIISYVIGYGVVGLYTAYHDYEVWALVAAFMTQMTLTALGSYIVAWFPIRFRHSSKQRRHFLHYGGRYSLIGFAEFLCGNLDALIIGKLFGVVQSGFYNRAALLANLPVQQPANILTKALFPIMSAVGEEQYKQAIGLQLSLLLVGSYAFAVSSGIYLAAPDIIEVVLGEKWLTAAPMLQIIVLAVAPRFMSHVAGVMLDSMNELKVKLRLQLSILMLISLLLTWAAFSGQILYIAAVVAISEWIQLLALLTLMARMLRIAAYDMLSIVLAVAVMALSTGLLIFAVTLWFPPALPVSFRLIADIIAGGVGLLLGFAVARFVVMDLPAVHFLAARTPLAAKLFRQEI